MEDDEIKRTLFYSVFLCILVALILFVALSLSGGEDIVMGSLATVLP